MHELGLVNYVVREVSRIAEENQVRKLHSVTLEFGEVSGVDWSGANYTDATTGVKTENLYLVYQDTYIMGREGDKFMHTPDVEIPESYYTVK